jgi:hypothetical protein
MAVYGPRCHPQNIIWTEAKVRSIYYFVGERPVHKLPFGPKCHELFAILYSIHAIPKGQFHFKRTLDLRCDCCMEDWKTYVGYPIFYK